MRPVLSALCAVASVCLWCAVPGGAQRVPGASVPERVAAQNKLFQEWYDYELRDSPELATQLGDYSHNGELDDDSLAGRQRRHVAEEGFLGRLRAIPTEGMGDTDRLSHDVLVRSLEMEGEGYRLKTFEMPINQMNGVQVELADLPLSMPFDTVQHYEDYVARLKKIPVALQQTTEVMRAGMRDGLMPPKFLLEKIPAQCTEIVTSNPFLIPTTKFPASMPAAEQQRLTAEVKAAVAEQVAPAYTAFAAFVRTEYAPKGRTQLSIESLPEGKARYAFAVRRGTTLNVTPEAVHATGLKEVARISAEMNRLAKQQGYADVEAWRKAINADPKWRPTSAEQIVEDFRKYIDGMQPKLPELFGLLPKAPVTVEPMPSFQAASATHYIPGTPDGKRAGRVVVAVANPTTRSLVDDEATAYHEGVPGHHMQISVAQELTGLPLFRTRTLFFTAYVEGWALYAEELGKDIGFYKDPVSDYGRLSSELFRAVRLVVDTGIHNENWTRQQVIDYMHANDVNDTLAQSETDRYIAWPGQALGYKMGQLKIRELRERAKADLGPKFDIKAFHDEILDGGQLPLDLLDARVTRWIAEQKAR